MEWKMLGREEGKEDEDKAQGEWLFFSIVPMSVMFRIVIFRFHPYVCTSNLQGGYCSHSSSCL
jgi:hypothetical protein